MAKKATTNTKPVFDLPAVLKESREAQGLSRADLARLVGANVNAICEVESGRGRADIMLRIMNCLKFELTGLAKGMLLHLRLRDTRELRREWSVEQLAPKAGVSVKTSETNCADRVRSAHHWKIDRRR